MKTATLRRKNTMRQRLILVGLFFAALPAWGIINPDTGVYMMPMNCGELLPDPAPYLNFFASVARNSVGTDRALSRRLFRVLSLREKIQENAEKKHTPNPIDMLVEKTVCFYREQKEPLKPVSSDDAEFVKFIKGAVADLENKVNDAVFTIEYDRQQRLEFERRARANKGIVQRLEDEADREADVSFEKLSKAARRKVKQEK
jgi:hypothetical protein